MGAIVDEEDEDEEDEDEDEVREGSLFSTDDDVTDNDNGPEEGDKAAAGGRGGGGGGGGGGEGGRGGARSAAIMRGEVGSILSLVNSERKRFRKSGIGVGGGSFEVASRAAEAAALSDTREGGGVEGCPPPPTPALVPPAPTDGDRVKKTNNAFQAFQMRPGLVGSSQASFTMIRGG